MSKVYITTAIPYVNGKPHLGHALDYLLADTYARFRTQLGDDVRFQSGTDEHGGKIFQKAADLNLSVEEYVAENAAAFQDFIKTLDASTTDFIRTTDKDHMRRCQEIWKKLEPHIYRASYEGWYCNGCERFVTDKEYEENNGICPDHQAPYKKLSEENYYLRIDDFREDIAAAINSGEMQILPEFRKNEILKLLADSPDVSISRPTSQLTWGIPVPSDDSQVMYVWLDALTNYITVLGYPDKDISAYWPATAQFVGKDILRFHAIIWPSILLGLGLPLPKTITSHGFITHDGQKMGKSLGNVVDPVEIINNHGLPAFRYFALRHFDTFADSDFTWEKFESAYNNELANDLGNLVQRLATLASKANLSVDFKIPSSPAKLDANFAVLMESFEFSKAFDHLWGKIQSLNKQIDEKKPWELAKLSDTTQLTEVLTNLITQLLGVAYLLTPFLPSTSVEITRIFTASPITRPTAPLFPRSA